MSDMTTIVEIRKAELHDVRVTYTEKVPLFDGQARLAVDSFGLTANNITYAVYGDRMSYWSFFPAPSGDDYGVVPVWGFATIVETTMDAMEEGERIYGYFPMGEELVVEPQRITPGSFIDGTAHRADLPVTYNNYVRCAGDPLYEADNEDAQMLLQPLFFTSFLIDDFLADADFFGATQVVATSASSKTGFGTAHLLHQREGITVIGLTSASNREFVEGLGCYDSVVTYDDIDSLPPGPSVSIDFAGNQQVILAIHEHYGDDLKHSSVIGGTHWDADRPESAPMPGPKREFFFAPARAQVRIKDWGIAELQMRLAAAWTRFL
ncbi:MAG: DUF2855 family protein, partial [Acidimicrobiia bacterium]|nr:DUF2855 family protein [Acidimicrobiia bacterium]NNL27958.1 DUF2855 family protein [Acidimicrobiia bacterium]